MKKRLLVMAVTLAMFGAVPVWADTNTPPEPAAAATSSSTSTCQSDKPANQAEGDPTAPQNQVEYGGGA